MSLERALSELGESLSRKDEQIEVLKQEARKAAEEHLHLIAKARIESASGVRAPVLEKIAAYFRKKDTWCAGWNGTDCGECGGCKLKALQKELDQIGGPQEDHGK